MRLFSCTLLVMFLLIANLPTQACRYNVRDVGMVNFADLPYKLYCFVDSSVSDEHIAAIRQISYAVMMDSNVEAEIVHLQNEPDHHAIHFYEETGKPPLPALALVSPKDRVLHIEWQSSDAPFKESVWNTIEYVAKSPFRETLLNECIEHYGVAVLFDGVNEEMNAKAEAACRVAVDKVKDGMAQLPKEIKNPPVYENVSRSQFESEKLLLWSYGIDPQVMDEPAVAIVYGRGRQIGKVLKGDEITLENVLSVLSVVGLSCECGLDRSWMMGTMFPLVWNDEHRKLAMENVGFDTESPMVKTEISQIMSKGSTTTKAGNGAGYSAPDPLLGYAEISLEDASVYEEAAMMREENEEGNKQEPGQIDIDVQSAEPEIHTKVESKTTAQKVSDEITIDGHPLSESVVNVENKTIANVVSSETPSTITTDKPQLNSQAEVNWFKSSSISNSAVSLFTILGIFGMVVIISGLIILFAARGRQA